MLGASTNQGGRRGAKPRPCPVALPFTVRVSPPVFPLIARATRLPSGSRVGRALRSLLVVASAALFVGACGEDGALCHLPGCDLPARCVITVQPTDDEPLLLDLCRNDACGTIRWALVDGKIVADPGSSLAYPLVYSAINRHPGGWEFFVFFQEQPGMERRSGDYFRVTISVESTGEVLANLEDNITYVEVVPNGPECQLEGERCLVPEGGPFDPHNLDTH